MQSRTTRQCWRSFRIYPRRSTGCQARISSFPEQSDDPGLQFKKLEGEDNIYSVRIGLEYRALAVMKKDRIVWY